VLLGMLVPFRMGLQAIMPSASSILSSHKLADSPVLLETLGGDASGITWNAETGTLFAIRNKQPLIQEISQSGKVLRDVALHGFSDTEGITWLYGNVFVVMEERTCSLRFIHLSPDTTAIDYSMSTGFSLPELNPDNGNKGCEDLAWDPAQSILYVSKEKSPARLLRISGLSSTIINAGTFDRNTLVIQDFLHGQVSDDETFGLDISGLHFDRTHQQLLVLSDESQKITVIDSNGNLAPSFHLGWFSNGLVQGIRQPEGVTLGGSGELYVLAEPNALYLFENNARGQSFVQ